MLRAAAPAALAILVRTTGDFDGSEDAMQDALVAAATQWPDDPPQNPRAWLVAVARRRYVEQVRADVARRRREERAFGLEPPGGRGLEASDTLSEASDVDDSLALLVLCAHPAVARPSQVALTLRAVGGLTTAEIARALFVPEKTIGQRISRAKARIRAAGATFDPPADRAELADRLATVFTVLAVIYTEGHTASSGESLVRVDLSSEAIRLTRMLRQATPVDASWRAEVDGLLALMLLTEARRPARLRAGAGTGAFPMPELVPLAEQDRSLWDASLVAEGVALVEGALGTGHPGPFQLQAAIAAVHDEAQSTDATDWREILALYDLLRVVGPGPMVELGRVVAVAMVHGPDAGLHALESVALEPALAGHFRVHAVRGHLLERAERPDDARTSFATAASLALNAAERRYLEAKAAALSH
ncbi:RNA polymerase sigma factor [Agromyces protaetiae]|uniref:RNA polymerase sigma factor n=2 Tax=Agromyces protaetiae TaxID=2509455 RepID=A0A4P6FFY7_9MICO|nr:RNA polymerase sigma factor [Agromyces protaetiae]